MSKPDFAITFLAFGEEHINEFNTTTKQLLDFDNNLHIYVVTDNKELIENKDIHIREIDEPFNYNLKRKSFEFAFEQHNVVMYMDTDILFHGKPDFNYVRGVDEGMHIKWFSGSTQYKGEIITIEDMCQTDYGKMIDNENIMFLNEFLMILRIDDPDKRKLFTNAWDDLNNTTLSHQPNNGYDGALEGLIISAICDQLNIKIESPRNEFFFNILNIGTLNYYTKKLNKSII
jgi:hypothetical protein